MEIESEYSFYNKFKYDYSDMNKKCDDVLNDRKYHTITFKCDECSREFLNQSGLKKHVKIHNRSAKQNSVIECPDCGKQLKLSSMSLHRKIHNENKEFSCDICGQKFVQKINLVHHTKIHTGEKPFLCSECQKPFAERSHLLRHQRYHASIRPHKCEKCGKMYKTERCLKVHSLVHLDQRPFVCTQCNKSFINSSKLKQHSNIHTGERPYKCKYCSRDFTNFPNWMKHTRRRHKVDHKTGESLQIALNYDIKQKLPEKLEDKLISTTDKNVLTKIRNSINISDIHSLSITSAEELIIEQALEMEEAGLIKSTLPFNADLFSTSDPDSSSPLTSLISSTSWNTEFSYTSNNFLQPPSSTMNTSNCFSSENVKLPSVDTLFTSNTQIAYSRV